jgi:hypothetical protein
MFSTRFECIFPSSPLVWSVVCLKMTIDINLIRADKGFDPEEVRQSEVKRYDLLHSFRVGFYIFPTRFEWAFTSFPLVSSVVFQWP